MWLAAAPSGELIVADEGLDAVFSVDRDTGDRAILSGCLDSRCTAQVGSGTAFVHPVDVVVVPEPGALPSALAVLATLVSWRCRAAA